MELAFFVNVLRDNTRHKLTNFNVPVIAKELSVAGIEISVGPMKMCEIMEVIDWRKVESNAEELAAYHFNLLKKQEGE